MKQVLKKGKLFLQEKKDNKNPENRFDSLMIKLILNFSNMKTILKALTVLLTITLMTSCSNDELNNESEVYGETIDSYSITKDKVCPPGKRDCAD